MIRQAEEYFHHTMKVNSQLNLDSVSSTDLRPIYEQAAKNIIDCREGWHDGWYLEFSPDSRYIRKRSL